MSADQDTIKSSTLRNFFIQKAEGLISVFTPLPNSVGFSLGSLCDAQQPIASPALLRLEKAGVSAGVLGVVYDPIRLIVVSVIQELANRVGGKKQEGWKKGVELTML